MFFSKFSTGTAVIFLRVLLASVFVFCCSCALNTEEGPGDSYRRSKEAELLLIKAENNLRDGGKKELVLARAQLQLALELTPNDARIIDGFGALAFQLGDFGAAGDFFRRAIQLQHDYARAYGNLALVEALAGNLVTSNRLFKKALELDPLDAEVRNNFAISRASLIPGESSRQQELRKAKEASSGAPADAQRTIESNMTALSSPGR
jgi:Flp pilus assembly protein TadD